MTGPPDVLVVGTVNVDLVARVRRRPAGGETVLAESFDRSSGGKGANQAVASARAGARTALLAAVGDDAEAGRELAALEHHGVQTDLVVRVPGARTGLALIAVTPDAENSIVVVPGANAELDPEQVVAVLTHQSPAVVVLQSEAPRAALDAACAAASGSRVVVNNGPWTPLAPDTLHRADPLVVNEHEARDAGASGTPPELAGGVRHATGARSVVVTLGADGVVIADGSGERRVPPAPAPDPVDSTGAGDTFVGTLSAHLATGADLDDAVHAAQLAAARSIGYSGARPDPGTADSTG